MAMWTARSKRSTRRPGQLPSDRASAESRTHLAQRISTSCMYTVMSHGRLGQEEPTCTLSGSSAHRRMMARSDSDLTRTHPRANLIPHMRGLRACQRRACQGASCQVPAPWLHRLLQVLEYSCTMNAPALSQWCRVYSISSTTNDRHNVCLSVSRVQLSECKAYTVQLYGVPHCRTEAGFEAESY